MYKRNSIKFASLLFIILFLSIRTFGIVEKLSIEEMTQRANSIVIGTVESAQSQWEETQGRKRIFTYVYVEVEKYIKGVGERLIEIKVPGGEVGEITQLVSDTPQFTPGERVILFLQPEFFQLVGWHQGKYNVEGEKISGLGAKVDDFINMIQKIESESYTGPQDVLPTQINQSERPLESLDTTSRGVPGASIDDRVLRKTKGANLTPFKPNDWDHKIVVSRHPGDHHDASHFIPGDTLFIDWAVINNGVADTEKAFYTRLYIDGILKQTWYTSSPLNPGYYAFVEDYSIGVLSKGIHTIEIVPNFDNQMTENNKNDNLSQKTIYVISALPSISSISPSKASAGTNTQVTINGSNFGATQDSSNVEFFYRSGQPKIEASSIDSWGNSQIKCRVPTALVSGYPASSSSGPVTVTTGSGTSNGYTFKVTFGYGGVKWSGTHPYVNYEINENTSDCAGEGAAVIAAANEWNNKCASFSFLYNGTTSSTTYSYNGHNEIMWGSTGGSIATNYYWYSGSNLLEFDIIFEDGFTWSTDGSTGTYDVQNIASHELGHALNLRDIYGNIGDSVYDTAKTMYGFGSTGETKKRTLHTDDIDGIRWIYGTGGDSWDSGDDTGSGGTTLSPTTTEQPHGRHTLTSCDQYDWFKIYMEAGYTYYFRSTCDFTAQYMYHGDTYGELYSDQNGSNRVDWDDDSGGNHQFSFNYTPSSAGTYFLRVRTYNVGYFWSGYVHYYMSSGITHTVSTPNKPSGLSSGFVNTSYSFTTGGSTDSLGHAVQYRFYWGNGLYSVWSSSTSASKAWSNPGTYQVQAQARCASNPSIVSGWSSKKAVTISKSWSTKRLTNNAADLKYSKIARSGSYRYVAFLDGNTLAFKRSTDGGATWGTRQNLSTTGTLQNNTYAHAIAAEGQYVHVVIARRSSSNWKIYYRRNTDYGASGSWGSWVQLTSGSGDFLYPDIAVDGQYVHIVFQGHWPGNWEIFYKRISNYGVGSIITKRLTYSASGASQCPRIATSSEYVYVLYQDDWPGNVQLFFKRLANYGAGSIITKRITHCALNSNHHDIAAHGQYVFVVFRNINTSTGNTDIFSKTLENYATGSITTRRLTYAASCDWPSVSFDSGTNVVEVAYHNESPGNYEIFWKLISNYGKGSYSTYRVTYTAGTSQHADILVWGGTTYIVYHDDSPGSYEIYCKYK